MEGEVNANPGLKTSLIGYYFPQEYELALRD